MVGDNAPKPDWWEKQPGRHCGQICLDRACPVCGDWVPPIGDNIELGVSST